MICELFPFQTQAVNDMRLRVAMALNNYRMLKIPQVVSLQAPTGSGKTIIMSALLKILLRLGTVHGTARRNFRMALGLSAAE